jgi:MFS family permease
LLRSHAPFRRLFLATTCSAVGTYLAALALSVDIFDRTGSGKWLAALLVADFLPIILIGLTLGPLLDRLERRRLMITADVARFAVFAALPFVDGPATIVALAGLNGVATGFFRPAVWAGVPNLVRDADLEEATSLLSTVENAAWMVGPVISGLLLTVSGPSAAYWINAVSFLVSAGLVARLRRSDLQSEESLSRGHWRDVRDGFSLVRRSAPLLTVLLVWNTAALGNASVNVAEVVFAKDELGAGNIGLGILVGATGLGLVIGSVISPTVLARLGMARVYGGALVVMGIGFGAAATAPSIVVAVPLVALATVGNGAAIVCNQLLVQRGAVDSMRGRALAVLMSSYYAVLPLSMAGAGWLTDEAGARVTWMVGAIAFLVASLIAFARTHRVREAVLAAPPPEPSPAGVEVATANGNGFSDGQPELTGLERLRVLLAEIEETRQAEAERTTPRRKAFKYARLPIRRS